MFIAGFLAWNLDDIPIIDLSTGLELIKNGGFETSTTYGYSHYYDSIYTFLFAGSKVSHSFESRGDPRAETLSQTVTMIAGHSYNIGFWLEDSVINDNSFIASIGPSA
ncbi:unnamed protein product [Rotaria magnacalcarata]|uniref:Uncharacterized protein n=2 Tax=Rotaria magnacalcarata TaxID=392030 RepID=A0A815G812_9BILA|nr:unnamed protein product [Rotaria magnacalcarata]CAF1652295.1 unnamed protein product [Rotaria magnacalcarata]CAF2059913.1 unnamed protein product [Rotaria magnacalcarata]CAF2161032.1 unnamed protein product [Rotaria magnacalcarata]CAF4289987.1 unnamed protein product [Rotaria magnacalcarata]